MVVAKKPPLAYSPKSALILPGKVCTLDDRQLQPEDIVESKGREGRKQKTIASQNLYPTSWKYCTCCVVECRPWAKQR